MKPLTDTEAKIRLREAQLLAGHRVATRKQYRAWVMRYRMARQTGEARDLQSYLTRLTAVEKVNPKTVKQALNALKFYHENVLGVAIAPNSLVVPKINPHRNIPVWLRHEEVIDLLGRMKGVGRLQAEMLYGTGARITALMTLRLKDIDLHSGIITFRHDKGGKSRAVKLPEAVKPRLMAHIAAVRLMWEHDQQSGIIYPSPEPCDMKKLGRKRYGTLPFCWLFPSRDVRGNERWHATDHALSRDLARAARESGITKRVSPHVLRHSNATALLELGENIRAIQEHLGHTHVDTTEIYTHATTSRGLVSPLDRLARPA